MKLGWELPNIARDLTAEEWERIDVLRSGAVKIRSYNLLPSVIAGIRSRNLTVVLRPDSDGDIDVAARVRELSAAAWLLRENGIGDIIILVDNEPNLGSKPVPSGYWSKVSGVVVGLWFGHFDTRALAATVAYASPPLAVGQGEEAWYEAGKDIIPAGDYTSVHCYGQLDTSLIDRSLSLAKQYGGGLPILVDEVGDSHPTAGWDAKGEALRVYLDVLRANGVSIAILFHVGGSQEWANFVPPIETVRMLAASVPQEEPTMPIQTDIIVSFPPAGLPVEGKTMCLVTGTVTGVDGTGMLTAFLYETDRAGHPNYANSATVSGIPIAPDGSFSFHILAPDVKETVAAALLLSTTELNPAAFQRGEQGFDAYQEPLPLVLYPFDAGVPAPVPQPQVPAALPPAYDIMFQRAGDIINAAEAVGDNDLAERGRDIHRAIDRRKAGK